MGGHIPRQRKLAGAEPSPAVEQVMVLPDGHAVIRQDLIQRMQGALRQPPFHVEHGVCFQNAGQRQKKS